MDSFLYCLSSSLNLQCSFAVILQKLFKFTSHKIPESIKAGNSCKFSNKIPFRLSSQFLHLKLFSFEQFPYVQAFKTVFCNYVYAFSPRNTGGQTLAASIRCRHFFLHTGLRFNMQSSLVYALSRFFAHDVSSGSSPLWKFFGEQING